MTNSYSLPLRDHFVVSRRWFALSLPNRQLPQPDPKVSRPGRRDVQGLDAQLSAAGAGAQRAPNVLIILLDDVGFGMAGTFGGPVPTPNLDKLAAGGLKYNRFHTTALCSPTRGALLAGRNHHCLRHRRDHRDGHRLSRATPASSRGAWRWCRRCSRDNGYATAHVRQVAQHAGDGDQPGRAVRSLADRAGIRLLLRIQSGRGAISITRRSTATRRPSPPPKTPEQGYHFTEDMTDETIAWTQQRAGGRSATNRGSFTSRPARCMRRIRCRRSGARSSPASSTTAGTSSAS